LQIHRLPDDRAPSAPTWYNAPMAKRTAASNKEILEAVLSLQEQFIAEKREMREYVNDTLDTKLAAFKEEIILRLTPTEKAVDTDAEMLVDHERRIRALEKNVVRP